MMEHIFRNLNDIRVFDTLSEFTKNDAIYFDDVMDMLDFPQRERIQIEDSIKHLIEQQIIGVEYSPEKYSSGYKTCKQTDDANLPRKKGHESHRPIIHGTEQIEKYYMLKNDLTTYLISAVFESSDLFAQKILKEKGTDL